MEKISIFLVLVVFCGLLFSGTAFAANGAAFVSQSVPTAMVAGQTYSVSVTMTNTGSTAWTALAKHKLGAQNPQDNWNWGMSRVEMSSGDYIAYGKSKTFTFNITAPSNPGTYNFQWKMVQENVQWFGSPSNNVAVSVTRPKSPLMAAIKSNGCVWDGLLSGYAGSETDSSVALLNRSQCQYLHRSLETWAWPPDFAQAQNIMSRITK